MILHGLPKLEPRRNYLIRKSVNLSKEAHIIASNIDLACFIFTLKHPETSLGFWIVFGMLAIQYNPLILFNKIDVLHEEIEIVKILNFFIRK
jgi:ribosome biogenesis GTPase